MRFRALFTRIRYEARSPLPAVPNGTRLQTPEYELRRTFLPRTRENRGTKRREEDRSGNVVGYRTEAMDCFGVSLRRGRRSRNAWPLVAKAES
jgi:hypothetical protein